MFLPPWDQDPGSLAIVRDELMGRHPIFLAIKVVNRQHAIMPPGG